MKLKYSAIAASLALISFSSSCRTNWPEKYDNSKLSTYDIPVNKSFNAISVANNIDIEYSVGRNVSVRLSTPAENRENVVIKVEDHTLVLRIEKKDNKRFNTTSPVKVTLTAPAVSTLSALNNSDITILNAYDVDNLSVTATNNAEISFKGNTTVTLASLTATNNAEISLVNAEAETMTATATNNADITFRHLRATDLSATATNNAEITITGRGDRANLSATNNAEISAGNFLVKSAECSAVNLADITVNAASLTKNQRNKGSIKNKH
ncbi:MAG: DUF2807 domain-containing protein [Muribaculaceae bacterium]|nr:DUF2807 domain-containing protein [Muribaculaceae bacterium]